MPRVDPEYESYQSRQKIPDDANKSFWIVAHCREKKFHICCDDGGQTFKWLGLVVKARYTAAHPQYNPEQYHVVHINDYKQNPLYPFQQIVEWVKVGEEIEVELIGPQIGLNDPNFTRQKTLWELYAYTPLSEYVSVEITFDASPYLPLDEPPGVFGNFNNWGVPITMKNSTATPHIYKHHVSFPACAEIVFKFAVGTNSVVGSNYYVVNDKDGHELNFFKLREAVFDYAELQLFPTLTMELKEDEPLEPEITVLPERVVGKFHAVPTLTDKMKKEQFEFDWKKMQFADKVRLLNDRAKIKEVLWKNSENLRNIFRFYSSQGGRDLAFMNVIKFIHFCHICKIPDKKITVSTIDSVFHRVNIEEEFDEEKIAANPQSYRYAMVLKEDPFNPNNQFIRGEFYESLVRLAVIKYKQLNAVDALTNLLEKFVLPNALEGTKDDVRDLLLADDVQRVYAVYSPKLYRMFNHYSQEDKADLRANASTTMNLKEYQLMLMHLGLLDHGLSRRIAMSAFALSQEDATGDDQESLYEMVYPEFLEVLARLADYRYGKNCFGALRPSGQSKSSQKTYDKKSRDKEDLKSNQTLQLAEKIALLFAYMFPKDVKAQRKLIQLKEDVINAEVEKVAAAEAEIDARAAAEERARKKTKKKKKGE